MWTIKICGYKKPSNGETSKYFFDLVENGLMIISGMYLETNLAKLLAQMPMMKSKKYGIGLFIDRLDEKRP